MAENLIDKESPLGVLQADGVVSVTLVCKQSENGAHSP